MPFKFFTGSPVKFVPSNDKAEEQSENPFAPNYIAPRSKNYYPPDFYKMRPRIIEKYEGRCFLCGQAGIDVHHVDYNKMNCKEENMVLLCKYCHGLTNFNVEYWERKIKVKMGQKEI